MKIYADADWRVEHPKATMIILREPEKRGFMVVDLEKGRFNVRITEAPHQNGWRASADVILTRSQAWALFWKMLWN